MRTILVNDWTTKNPKTLAELAVDSTPEIGDQVLVLDGDNTATYRVLERRWVFPNWYGRNKQTYETYLILRVESVDSPNASDEPRAKRVGSG